MFLVNEINYRCFKQFSSKWITLHFSLRFQLKIC
jgi:hypothetical protein